jgi:NADH-quinone oxidoreductase subunit F
MTISTVSENNMANSSIETNTTPNHDIDIYAADAIVEQHGRELSAVIPVLQAIQNRYNYLPEPILRRVCEITEIRPADIEGVATFYAQFRFSPAGRYRIRVCIGTACHVKGAEKVFDAFKHHLSIPESEDTDTDRLFTVEQVACLGCCMLAPVVRIEDVTYGYLDTQKVPPVLQDFLVSQESIPSGVTRKRQRRPEHAQITGEIRMCTCSSCSAAGAADVFKAFSRFVIDSGMPARVKTVGCTGISYEAPLVEISLSSGQSFQYGRVKPADARDILTRHFKPTVLTRRITGAASLFLEKLLKDEILETPTRYQTEPRQGFDSLYWGRQKHIVTEHCGALDPLDLQGYIEHHGFEALKRCAALSPNSIIDALDKSGLRGRGGAGYPTAKKWLGVFKTRDKTKYLICNGDEGDPGAFMDRMILESFPFRVIEGMAIAALTLGTHRGFIYIRDEYPLAIKRVREALRISEEYGIIGESIMGTGKHLHLELVEGAGAFVSGEETALIAAIEGQRGMPRFRPPYPDRDGLWHKPTLVNNVETFALIPWILNNGAEQFSSIGTESSSGTKTFALAGKVIRGGLIEVPMGITLREIVESIGGGIREGNKLKAIQVGGPSGGCVPADLADTPVDYEALLTAGAIMGSGGLIVLDETDCMVDIARYFMSFTQRESCGKCTSCRIGTKCMLEILEKLCAGTGHEKDIGELEHLAQVTRLGSLCGLGRTASNPVLSTLRYFREEYEAHARGHCPAKKCRALISYSITDDCIGCTRCAQNCPAGAIQSTPYQRHEIDTDTCIRCGTCMLVCPSDAVIVG